jgi:hypothetical protein
MRNITLWALLAGVLLTGCQTLTPAERIAQLNADHGVWPPVVEGQPFPVQTMKR